MLLIDRRPLLVVMVVVLDDRNSDFHTQTLGRPHQGPLLLYASRDLANLSYLEPSRQRRGGPLDYQTGQVGKLDSLIGR